MNYYPFHLGDYTAHTQHLEPLEDLAYRRMLDLYYLTETPLPESPSEVARLIRMRNNVEEVTSVLQEFFILQDSGWTHDRCEKEIVRFHDKKVKAKASAEASVAARKAKLERTLNERSTNVQQAQNVGETKVKLPEPEPEPEPKDLSFAPGDAQRQAETNGHPKSQDSLDLADPPPKPPPPQPKPRARDPLMDAMATYAEDSDPTQVTGKKWQTIGVAVAQIRKASPDVTPDEIRRRCENYRTHWDATLTAMALANHWGRCQHPKPAGSHHAANSARRGEDDHDRPF